MKSNLYSLSLLPIILTALSNVATLRAQGLDCAVFPECCELVEACNNAPNNTAMVTQYANGVNNAWADGACMPYVVNGSIAQVAVFCQNVFCTGYVNADCTGTVADLVLLTDFCLPNALNFTNWIGKAAICNNFL